MENKKETAVAWLYKKLAEILCDVEVNPVQTIALFDTLKQAKEMEKQQIIDANEDASTNELGEFLTGKQYYNKKYGS